MFKRMRNASKTTDELVNYWNERCVLSKRVPIVVGLGALCFVHRYIIEEEYALKLAKLSKLPIGSDETG